MLYVDNHGKLHTIGQVISTQKISLTANVAQSITLDENSIYRIVPLDLVYIAQSSSSSVMATVNDCPIIYNSELYINTFGGQKYISLIAEVDCDVFITKMS